VANIRWAEIEALLVELGAEIIEAEGSRIRVVLRGRKAVFHRPHPSPQVKKGTIKNVRKFLEGIELREQNRRAWFLQM
jgi:hypothetical protein